MVWLDIDTLTASDAWQSLPPDIYNGSVSLNLEYMSNISTGRIKDLNTTTTVSIRKQAYFSGLSVPSTNVAFNTSYTQDQVVGYASTPLILQAYSILTLAGYALACALIISSPWVMLMAERYLIRQY
ncbi:Uncharacterised protein [Edwardsiella ictaluri]|nr:Uncharacterised protein [Edwardsiella ictaluri]